jgi:hypothetical protein
LSECVRLTDKKIKIIALFLNSRIRFSVINRRRRQTQFVETKEEEEKEKKVCPNKRTNSGLRNYSFIVDK